MSKRDEILKAKIQEAKRNSNHILSSNDGDSARPSSRKRGHTHFGMMTIDVLKKKNEEAEKEIQRLKDEIDRLVKVSATNSRLKDDLARLSDEIRKGAAIVELDPSLILVKDHDRNEKSLETEEFYNLKRSIKETGQLIPIIIRQNQDGELELVAGFRRLNAAKQLGFSIKALITDVEDDEAAVIKAAENHVREDLDAFERAKSFYSITKEKKILSAKKLAAKLGISQPSVSQYTRLMSIPEEIQSLLTVEYKETITTDDGVTTVLRRKTPGIRSLVKIAAFYEKMEEDAKKANIAHIRELLESKSIPALSSTNPEKRADALIRLLEGVPEQTLPRRTNRKITDSSGTTLATISTRGNDVVIKIPDKNRISDQFNKYIQRFIQELEQITQKD